MSSEKNSGQNEIEKKENENALHIKTMVHNTEQKVPWPKKKSTNRYPPTWKRFAENVTRFSPREQLSLIHEKKHHKSIRMNHAKRSDASTKKKWLDKRPVKKEARWSMKENEDVTASRGKNPFNHQKFTRCNKHKSFWPIHEKKCCINVA